MNPRLSSALRIAVIGLILFGLLAVFGIRAAHPKSGLKSALGSASSSVAIYHKTSAVSKGSKIIVTTGQGSSDPALALVNNIEGDDLDIQIGTNLMRVSVSKNLQGKLVAVIPFIGYVAGVLRL